MGLPCRHIFKFRKIKDLHLFDITLYMKRWTKEFYMKDCEAVFSRLPINLPPSPQEKITSKFSRDDIKLTSREKYKLINNVCSEITNTSTDLRSSK